MKPDFENLKNLYGWCIYDLEISKSEDVIKQNPDQFFKAAGAIVGLVDQGRYSPYVRTVFKVVRYLKSMPNYRAEQILEWLNKLDPNCLPMEPGRGRSSRGRTRSYPSDREKWYANRCKALYAINDFETCLALGKQALQEIPGFHNNNDIWIRWRIALSKDQLGHTVEAIEDLKALVTQKKDWFIQRDLARMLHKTGIMDDALRYATEAALNAADLEYKWELFYLMGEILHGLDQLDLARQHILLAVKLRQEHSWKIGEDLQHSVDSLNIDLASEKTSSDLHRALKPQWESVRLSQRPQKEGWILKVLGGGRSGFISGDDAQQYHFHSRELKDSSNQIKPGLRVRFFVEENSNPGELDEAVYISMLPMEKTPSFQGEVLFAKETYGFIQGEDGQRYYFQPESFEGTRDVLASGLKVSYHVINNPDPEIGDTAVHIRQV
jgi:tetratricopeptide (TPR) repeat protein